MIRYPKIREFRILHDLKQEYIADQLGISQPEYSRLENGFRKVRLEDFKKLSKIYDVHINILMTREAEYEYEPKSKKKASTSTPSFQDVQITQLLDQHAQILQFLKNLFPTKISLTIQYNSFCFFSFVLHYPKGEEPSSPFLCLSVMFFNFFVTDYQMIKKFFNNLCNLLSPAAVQLPNNNKHTAK
jgi:transcriptional regulator with XRE-family HTH domain